MSNVERNSMGQNVLVVIIGVIAALNTWRSYNVLETSKKALLESNSTGEHQIANELPAISLQNEAILLILLGWILFFIVLKR